MYDDKLSNLQVFFFGMMAVVGGTILYMPQEAAVYSETGGWLSILIAGIIIIIFIKMIAAMSMKNDGRMFFEYSGDVFGNKLSKVVNAIMVVNFLLMFVVDVLIFAFVMRGVYMPKTPYWAFAIMLAILTIFVASRKLKVISFLSVVFGIFVYIFVALIFLLISSEGKITNIMPLFIPELLPDYLIGGVRLLHFFSGFLCFLFVPFYTQGKKKNVNAACWSMVLLILYYILSYETCLALAGSAELKVYKSLMIAIAKRVRLEQFGMLQRADIFLFASYITTVMVSMVINMYGCIAGVGAITKKKGNRNLRAAVLTLVGFMIVFALLFGNHIGHLSKMVYVNILAIIIVIIAFFIILIKEKKCKTKEDSSS